MGGQPPPRRVAHGCVARGDRVVDVVGGGRGNIGDHRPVIGVDRGDGGAATGTPGACDKNLLLFGLTHVVLSFGMATPTSVKKSVTAALNASGASWLARCPASGISTSREPEIASAMARDSGRPVTSSSAP